MECKKLLLILVVSIVLCPVMAFALDVPDSQSIQASVTPTGGVEEWTAVLKNVSGDLEANSIGWSGVTAGIDQYKVADQYIEVTVNITNPISWRMLIYTNNTSYTGDKSKGSYGLVNTGNDRGLPLAWRVQEDLGTPDDPVFSITRPDPYPEGFTDYMWKFVVDQTQTGTDGWDVTDAYVWVWDNYGFYWNEGVGADMDSEQSGNQPCPAPSLDDKVFIYLGAGFTHSLAEEYSTTSLTLDMLQL